MSMFFGINDYVLASGGSIPARVVGVDEDEEWVTIRYVTVKDFKYAKSALKHCRSTPDPLHASEEVIAELRAQLAAALEDKKRLVELLWHRHGCPSSALYGDDGEMQCGVCLIDFKRATVEAIESRLEWLWLRDLAAMSAKPAQPGTALQEHDETHDRQASNRLREINDPVL